MTAISATNQELGRIAGVQHHTWGIINASGNRSIYDKPLEFKVWLLDGMNKYNEKKGFVFETVCPGLMRIKRPGFVPVLRTLEDFQREYEEYKRNY